MTEQKGPWRGIWRRFTEAPKAYPGIPGLLDRAQPQTLPPDPSTTSRPTIRSTGQSAPFTSTSGPRRSIRVIGVSWSKETT